MKKKILLTIIFMLFPIFILSQTLYIHKNNGTVINVDISAIDSITFTTQSSTPTPCPGIPTVTYAGKVYNTIQIGDQCWLKENLDVGTMIESNHGGSLQTDNGEIEKYCYDNNASNCDKYGGLYEWTEAMQYVTTEGAKGICPDGWHIPTRSEFETLEAFVDDKAVKLIDEGQTMSGYTPTNETGFSALFAGYRSSDLNSSFGYRGSGAYFWSSTENNSNYAYNMYLSNSKYDVLLYDGRKDNGFSVRCLKD